MNLKLSNTILILIIICFGCSPMLNYEKNQKLKQVDLPFDENNYKNDGSEFFEIVNTNNKNINIARERALLQAKTLLAQQLNFYITSIAEQDLNFDSKNESEKFNSLSKSFSILLAENVNLIDSKLFRNSNGNYDYWAVYSLKLNDIKDLNKSQTIVSSESYNKELQKIDSEEILNADRNTKPNTYLPINDIGELANRAKIELESLGYVGVPYLWGGNTPDKGFDCSGFVRWVYKKSLNILLKRTTLEHENFYSDIIKKQLKDFKKGDLVYFKTSPNRNISHVGIYLEDNKFIHAPNSNENIKIEEIAGYWLENYIGYASAVDLINLMM